MHTHTHALVHYSQYLIRTYAVTPHYTFHVWITLTETSDDYINLETPLIFPSSLELNQTLCINITVVDDNILESTEFFIVSIDSSDDSIFTGVPATVSIIDNDG